ncbi:MAG: fatty acid desaturase [Polyangiaceae bacterium]|nr:fatty acid desaturase [Polyangiaceae bacterium]
MFDASHIDLEAFALELRQLRKEIDASMGEEDIKHLKFVERVGTAATLIGAATAWMGPNPVSMLGLSFGRSTRWILMHHIGHRGYDKVPGIPEKYTSRVFARGKRRFLDWADWMVPEAWMYEHNVLHHSFTGEERDPDLVERNVDYLRNSKLPMPARYAVMSLLALSWKYVYYAPNTLRVWMNRHDAQEKKADGTEDNSNVRVESGHEKTLWMRCYLPFAGIHFGLFPALYLPLGPLASLSALINSVGAELLTNIHTFSVIVPNHTGEDVYRFDSRPKSNGDAMLRQVIGSVNFATGPTDWTDIPHLFLNYQIEHHIWPDLPMLQYRKVQPKVKALCEKHGIPYLQESVFTRLRKMLDVSVGKTSMKNVRGVFRKAAEKIPAVQAIVAANAERQDRSRPGTSDSLLN